ncbi:MAG: 30S ribosomal protein S11 [Patescibacteria group bacterium]
MGKKRVIQKGEQELSQEGEALVVPKTAPQEALPATPEKKLREGRVYINSSYNNTLMTLVDLAGNVISNVSAGSIGFKGTKKATPFAASKVAEALFQIARNKGIEKIQVLMKGIGSGRDAALRSIGGKGIEIVSIKDITPIPHNGPRPPKARRV